MIVNPDVDIYTKLEIGGKYSENSKKTTYWKPEEYSIPKYNLSWSPIFRSSLPGAVRAHAPVSYATEGLG